VVARWAWEGSEPVLTYPRWWGSWISPIPLNAWLPLRAVLGFWRSVSRIGGLRIVLGASEGLGIGVEMGRAGIERGRTCSGGSLGYLVLSLPIIRNATTRVVFLLYLIKTIDRRDGTQLGSRMAHGVLVPILKNLDQSRIFLGSRMTRVTNDPSHDQPTNRSVYIGSEVVSGHKNKTRLVVSPSDRINPAATRRDNDRLTVRSLDPTPSAISRLLDPKSGRSLACWHKQHHTFRSIGMRSG